MRNRDLHEAERLAWRCQQLVTQEFLSPVVFPEASLIPENLSTVLDIMSDGLWREFGAYANIPVSEMDRIKAQCTSDRECKQALVHSFISSHPAPSWTLVAWALYMTERHEGDGSSHRALDRLQQLFPTGTVDFLGWLTLPSTWYTLLPCRKIPLQTDLRAGDERRSY